MNCRGLYVRVSFPARAYFFYHDGAATKASAKRKRQHAGMSAANVGAIENLFVLIFSGIQVPCSWFNNQV